MGTKLPIEGDGNQEVGMRRKHPIFEHNPSIGSVTSTISRKKPTNMGKAYLITQETGEVIGSGGIGFIEETEVDSEQFVKVYLAGIKQYAQLSRPGNILFEFIYGQISGLEGKDKDTVFLNLYLATKWKPDLTKSVYYRGVTELLDKAFIYNSHVADMYFVNVKFMFNGDRMVIAKAYRRKPNTTKATAGRSTKQPSLPFPDQEEDQ